MYALGPLGGLYYGGMSHPTRRALAPLVVLAAFVLTFSATAHAAAAVTPADGSLWDLLTPVLDAFRSGHYLYAGSVALVLGVALTRRYLEPKYAWLGTDAGAAGLVLAGSFGATLAATLSDGQSGSWTLVGRALGIAFGAAGGYAVLKATVIGPYLKHLSQVGPKWMHYPASLVLWIFSEDGKQPTPAELVQKAMGDINAPDRDVIVSVVTPAGSAVASSPAVPPPAPVSIAVSRTSTADLAPATPESESSRAKTES